MDVVQHMRWSSNCKDERPTAKKSKRASRESPERVPPQPSSYLIRKECDCCDSLEVITHPHREDISAESIAMCQLNQSPEKKTVTINVPTRMRNHESLDVSEKCIENERGGYMKLKNPEVNLKEYKHRKYMNSLENISDSIQSLLGCTSAYNFCQSKRNLGDSRRKYGKEAMKSELEPLFFVGEKELYYNKEEDSDTKIVVHHYPKHAEERVAIEDILPEVTRPKRYSRSSFKKQKVSLYNEHELDLYMKVPTNERKPPPKKENKATETEKPKSSSSSSRDTAEMKRKTFLRKISLQDTYLNYNQDYWLDFKKSVRFHKSIDLGYFGDSENKKAETPPAADKSKPRLSERITEKSSEVIDEDVRPAVPYETEWKASNSESTDSWSKPTQMAVMADFQRPPGACAAKNIFLLPSSENIPLFCERNGNIETDFDVFSEVPDSVKADATVDAERETRLGESSDSGEHYCEPRLHHYDIKSAYDFSQFYEIKLNTEPDQVKRSNVFNFQGGHAFFGENRTSTSDDSDVFYNETDIGEGSDRTSYPGRILYVSGSEKPRNSGMV